MGTLFYLALTKYVALIVLPAVTTLWAALGKIWGWPFVTEVTATISAVDVFMGAVLQISSAQYHKEKTDE